LAELEAKLPDGAYKHYYRGELCIAKIKLPVSALKACHQQLEQARLLDDYPLRVAPEINNYIRQLRVNNVVVVDPEKYLIKSMTSISDYNEHFVDFQHPSSRGHFLIAQSILRGLDPQRQEESVHFDDCDNIYIRQLNAGILISPNSSNMKKRLQENLLWLNHGFNSKTSKANYKYYKEKAERKLKCLDSN